MMMMNKQTATGLVVVLVALLAMTAAEAQRVSTLNLVSSNGQSGGVVLGKSDAIRYEVGVQGDGTFSVNHGGKSLLKINKKGALDIHAPEFTAAALNADVLSVDGVQQWRLAAHDTFENKMDPWTSRKITNCQGLAILSPESPAVNGSRPSMSRYINLPEHSQVRLVASFHMWDDWQGECALMQAGKNIVWSHCHTQVNADGIADDLCGSKSFVDSKFNVPIDVSFAHSTSELTVAVEATTSAASAAGFGISSLSIYVRSD